MGFMEEDIFRDEKGRLTPGHKGLKPKGANNRLQSEIKEKITLFLNGKLERIEEVYSQVAPKDKLKFLSELLAYVLPKSREIKIEEAEPIASFDYTKLSEASLKEVLALTTIQDNEEDN
jgi:hypothetical protein